MRSLRFLIGTMFIITALLPIMSIYNPLNMDTFEEEDRENPFGEPMLLDDLRKEIRNAVGAPCPAIQNDGGSPGDAGNATTGTAKALGNNPTTSFTSCADSTDIEDWYEFDMDQDYNIEVTMSNYANDYDLAFLERWYVPSSRYVDARIRDDVILSIKKYLEPMDASDEIRVKNWNNEARIENLQPLEYNLNHGD